MDSILTILILLVVTAGLAIQIFFVVRKDTMGLGPIWNALQGLEKTCEGTERLLREEIGRSRQEAADSARQSREELANALKAVGDSLQQRFYSLAQTNDQKLDSMREAVVTNLLSMQEATGTQMAELRRESSGSAKLLRDEMAAAFNSLANNHTTQLKMFAERLDSMNSTNSRNTLVLSQTLEDKINSYQTETSRLLSDARQQANLDFTQLGELIAGTIKGFNDSIGNRINDVTSVQGLQLNQMQQRLIELTQRSERRFDQLNSSVDERLTLNLSESSKRLDQMRQENVLSAKETRGEISASLKQFNDFVLKTMTVISDTQKQELGFLTNQLNRVVASNEQRLDLLRTSLEEKLKAIQDDNARQLEQMRNTVDEKLQGTLERRLGESFKQVSEHLEQVYKGLGEMQKLATGVGDLKRVLTNVKTRGVWGEVQLSAMLQEVLTPDQYATNVSTKNNGERVEFAIKLPGRSDDHSEVVWLPIDAKFPLADYERLMEAQEKGESECIETASKQLENRIKLSAREISEKYIDPPHTTDFAIMFLPTEGLFAEVIRRIGLAEHLQKECKVVVAGPTTLWSLLNSLQIGFRTLAVQRRSAEVWNILGAVKTQWTKYGDILDRVQKKLHEASETIDKAQTRTRVIGKKLRDVELMPINEADALLTLEAEIEQVDDNELVTS